MIPTMMFHIITTQRNAGVWLPRCVQSIEHQVGQHFKVMICDDDSDDGSTGVARALAEEREWGFLPTSPRRGALWNQVAAIRYLSPLDDEVIVFVDGDDFLAHDHVLERLAHHYSDDTLVAYGSYTSVPLDHGCAPAEPYPQHVIDSNSFRDYTVSPGGRVLWNHIRTMKASVFYKLDNNDFKDRYGNWFTAAPDAALMYPALELARGKIKCIPEVLYCYNSENQSSEWRVDNGDDSDRCHRDVLSRRPK